MLTLVVLLTITWLASAALGWSWLISAARADRAHARRPRTPPPARPSAPPPTPARRRPRLHSEARP